MNPRAAPETVPGLKERELDLACCPLCRNPVVRRDYPPLFWRVKVERFCADARAVERRHGLGLLLGSQALARHMGPDEDMAKLVSGPREVFVCEPCVLEHLGHLMVLFEQDDTETVSRGGASGGSGVPPGSEGRNPPPAPPIDDVGNSA